MAVLHPIVKTRIDTSELALRNLLRTVTWGVVFPAKSFTGAVVGDIYEFNSVQEAINTLGTDTSDTNTALEVIQEIFQYNPYSVVKYCYPGENTVDSSTTINNAAGYLKGATVITLAAAPTLGDVIVINPGTEQEQVRKVLAVATNDATIQPLDFDISDTDPVDVIQEFDRATNLPTCRTALQNEEFRVYIEDSYGSTNASAIATYIDDVTNGRDENDLYTQAFFGFDYGVSQTDAKLQSDLVNSRHVQFVYGLGGNAQKGTRSGAYTAAVVAARFAADLSAYNLESRPLITLNNRSLTNSFSTLVGNEVGAKILPKEADDLLDNNVSALLIKPVDLRSQVVIHKVVTTYQADGAGQPDTTYSNISDPNIDIQLREIINRGISQFLDDQIEKKNPINSNTVDLLITRAQSIVNDYTGIDVNPDSGGFTPIVTGEFDATVASQYNLSFRFKAIDSIDRVITTAFKVAR